MPEEDQAYYKQPDIQDWYKRRFDDDEIERRKAWLRKHGLSGMIHLELLHDQLWAIVFTPDAGFHHLKNKTASSEQANHISICFKDDIDERWKQQALKHLHSLYGVPVHHVFKVERFTSGLTAVIPHDDSVYTEIRELHAYGSYHYKEIHISL